MYKQSSQTENIIVFVFSINNKFVDYAECAKFINAMNQGGMIINGDFFNHIRIIENNEPINILPKRVYRTNQIINARERDLHELTPQLLSEYNKKEYKKAYHFNVSIDKDSGEDIVNLQYYFLFRQMYPEIEKKGGFSLSITPNNDISDDSLIYKIGQFLAIETNKDSDSIFYEANMRPKRLPYSRTMPKRIKKLGKFFPLIEITRDSYDIMTKSVGDVVFSLQNEKKPPKTLPLFTDKSIFTFSSNNEPVFDLSYLLLSNSLAFLQSTGKTRKSQNVFFQPAFFDLVKELPLLTLMFFAVAATIDQNNDEINIAIYEAADYAAGILQLLDNVVEHSQKHNGYFSFRLHISEINNPDEGNNRVFNNNYLNTEYSNYGRYFLNLTTDNFPKGNGLKNHEIVDERNIDQLIDTNSNYDISISTDLPNSEPSIIESIKEDSKKRKNEVSFLELFVIDTIDLKHIEKPIGEKSPVNRVFYRNVINRINDGEVDLQQFLPDLANVKLIEFFSKSKNLLGYEAYYSNITRHYGLKRFSNSVAAARGFFSAVSTFEFEGIPSQTYYQQEAQVVTSSINNKGKIISIPGTKYQILLPLNHRDYQQKFVGIDANVNWLEDLDIFLFENWKEIPVSLSFENEKKNERVAQNGKKIIETIRTQIDEENGELISVFIFDISENQKHNRFLNAELLSKSILYALSSDQIAYLKQLSFVVENCPKHFIPEFVHNMMIAYDRFNPKKRSIMKNRQIYCCGENPFDDFLIMGKDLKEMRHHMINRAALQGSFPSFLLLINYIMGKQDSKLEEAEDMLIEEIPFDLILKKNNKTLFEIRTEKILNNSINQDGLGCRISDSHIRIGSKIHVHNFYDADVLFQNNYFTTRFAALLTKDILLKIIKDINEKPMVYKLVGYGNYSEMVISQTQKLLQRASDRKKLGKTFVYEQYDIRASTEIKLHPIIDKVDEKYIFIVPVNSTLTTHNKLHSLYIELIGKDDTKVLANYAIILVRDKVDSEGISTSEKQYWSTNQNHVITTRLLSSPVTYFIEVPGNWEDPLKCPLCFPYPNYSEEKPVIETNITSVIPMLQLERKFDFQNIEFSRVGKTRNQFGDELVKPKKIQELSSVAIYKHIKRDDNHYLFYFLTEKLCAQNSADIRNWLRDLNKRVNQNDIQCYNFIVAPVNESNANFLELINEEIFHDSAHILRFEINREYRNNFLAKYSYISELYENLRKANFLWPIKSRINFFFADDGIITGRTFERARSLITSLIPTISKEVSVSIFEGIFVLINRLSRESVKNFTNDVGKYYYYANFPISSIRNSSDFCYMCKISQEGKELAESSSLNDMQFVWKNVYNSYKPVESYKIVKIDEKTAERSKKRVIYASRLTEVLRECEPPDYQVTQKLIISEILEQIALCNDPDCCKEIIALENNNETKAVLESYLKLMARPFFIYKYSIRKVLLEFILFLLDIFIFHISQKPDSFVFGDIEIDKQGLHGNLNIDTINTKEKIFSQWIHKILQETDENKIWLFNLLLEQLTELNSTRIFRRDFILFVSKMLRQKQKWFDNSRIDRFENPYLTFRTAVKQISFLSKDESKCAWLEFLLVTGQEYQNIQVNGKREFLDEIWNSTSNLGMALYLENTKVISDALSYLNIADRDSQTVLNDKDYYLDNFRQLLKINGLLQQDITSGEWSYRHCEKRLEDKPDKMNRLQSNNSFNQLKLELDYSHQIPNQNKETVSIPEEINIHFPLIEEHTSIFTYEKVISSMIELQRFLIDKSKDSTQYSKDIFLDDIERLCRYLYEISLGKCSELLIVPPVSSFDSINDIVSALYINPDWKSDIERPIYNKENFTEGNFNFKTYHYSNMRLIMKITDGDESQKIFIAIDFSPESKHGILNNMEYVFSIRNILLFRNLIQKMINNHINGSSIQAWVDDRKKEKLLENIKNFRHSDADNSQLENAISKLIYPTNTTTEKYPVIMQAIILRLLADINISSIYRDTIISPKYYTSNITYKVSKWYEKGKISSVFTEELVNSFIPLTTEGTRMIEWGLSNIADISSFYLTNAIEGFLVIISLIENAIKFCPEGGRIKIETCPYKSEAYLNGLHYFCITNDLREKYKNPDEAKKLKEQLRLCLLNPVENRSIDGVKTEDHMGGVSLYAANYYCRGVLSSLELVEDYNSEPVIDFSISDSSSTYPNQLTLKIPLIFIKGKEEK